VWFWFKKLDRARALSYLLWAKNQARTSSSSLGSDPPLNRLSLAQALFTSSLELSLSSSLGSDLCHDSTYCMAYPNTQPFPRPRPHEVNNFVAANFKENQIFWTECPGVNFINIKRMRFSYKHLFGSFSLVTLGLAPKFSTKNVRV